MESGELRVSRCAVDSTSPPALSQGEGARKAWQTGATNRRAQAGSPPWEGLGEVVCIP